MNVDPRVQIWLVEFDRQSRQFILSVEYQVSQAALYRRVDRLIAPENTVTLDAADCEYAPGVGIQLSLLL